MSAIYPGNDFVDMQVLGARLAQVTQPDDKVFVFGADAEILFYAQRVSATSYIFLFPLYGPYPDAEAKQTAAANEIAANAPAAVVFLPDQLFFAPGSEPFFTQWSEHYITENFRIDSCVAIDPQGNVIVVTDVPHQMSAVMDGLKLCGTLDVRKGAGPPAK